MGNGASKEEQLYQAVQNGNTNAVKALRHDGASLEVRVTDDCSLSFYPHSESKLALSNFFGDKVFRIMSY
jgi:hypothetical protein